MDNRRFLMACVLSLAAIMLWSYLFAPRPTTEPMGDINDVGVEERASNGGTVADGGGFGDSTEEGSSFDGSSTSGVDSPVVGSPNDGDVPRQPTLMGEREERAVVETDRYRVELSSLGGQIARFELKGYRDGEGADLDMVRARAGGLLPFGIVDQDSLPVAVNQELFVLEQAETSEGQEVVFRYRGDAGSATKRFLFPDDGFFQVEVEYTSSYGAGQDWGVFIGPGVENPTLERIEQPQFWRGGAYRSRGDTETVDARKRSEVEELSSRDVAWAALDDQYFLKALIPVAGVESVSFEPYLLGIADEGGGRVVVSDLLAYPKDKDLGEEQELMVRELALVARTDGPKLSTENYWGAKVYDELKELPLALETAVDYGFFGFLARPLQVALKWVYSNVVANYGWAIVLTTLMIRLLLLPLTHQAMASGQKMQELNPKIKSIRAKYKKKLKDKQGRPNMDAQQQMQQEIMAIYKTAGVNPAMGCLPMLVQIPVFFAFYELLKGAIELRQAPWIGWIEDLSVMDPHYALPLVMFASQFIQQLRMPMGVDPMQRRLFLIMPFIFLFVFLQFPAGLVLYWLTSNIVSIVQQEVYKYLRARKAREAEAAAAG